MFVLSDVFIGDYPVKESYGQNPSENVARYKLQGYPGLRFGCPTNTPILAASGGVVFETGFEPAGKGKYIHLLHTGFLTTYGHLNDIQVQLNEKVVAGQLIGHSNQSGFTDIPCLYFGIAPCDLAGNKTEDNGYGGYINPMDDTVVKWEIKNLSEPITHAEVIREMKLDTKEYAALNAQATNYRLIVNFLEQTGLNDFLKEAGRAPINLKETPEDTAGGDSVVFFLERIGDQFEKQEAQIKELTTKNIIDSAKKTPSMPPPLLQKSFMLRLINAIGSFIFLRWHPL